MLKFLYIAAGGAIGALLRYLSAGLAHRFFNAGFPWGTLSVNLLGSFFVGLLWGLSETVLISQNMRLFLFIGILGAFTTFSAFSLENFNLLRDGEYWFAALNVFLNVFFGIALVFAGYFMLRSCAGIFK